MNNPIDDALVRGVRASAPGTIVLWNGYRVTREELLRLWGGDSTLLATIRERGTSP